VQLAQCKLIGNVFQTGQGVTVNFHPHAKSASGRKKNIIFHQCQCITVMQTVEEPGSELGTIFQIVV